MRLAEATEYPFRDQVTITIEPSRAVAFPLDLRIPAWCPAAEIRVNGKAQPTPKPGSMARIEREWRAGDRVELRLAAAPRAIAGYNGSVSYEQGPLVFALPVPERWRKLRQRGLTADWEIFPAEGWAHAVDASSLPHRAEHPVGPVPFSRRAPAVTLHVRGAKVEGWPLVDGSAAAVPGTAKSAEAPRTLTLMPYAAPKLRVTSFPLLQS